MQERACARWHRLLNFAYLMTRFTTPEELFGSAQVSTLKRDKYSMAGKLVEAELVLLDEIFIQGEQRDPERVC
ncbi:MAG: hypothetical protein J2P21_18340 [Chloracidobacterium sp.]|nr:hypothetical protein [Chloracidobacterium sp.]